MALAFTPGQCYTYGWNPIAAASSQSAIAAVLAGFVFAGIIVVLSVMADDLKREAAQALKLLFTAFFGLADTSYLLAEMAGDQICPRAQTTEVLAAGALGAFAVVMITSLTWLVVAYKRQDHNVLKFLHGLMYVSCIFIAFLLITHSISYLEAELPYQPHSLVNVVLYAASGLFLMAGALLIWKAPKNRSESGGVSITSDSSVNWCAWAALIYLTLTSLATGVAASSPPRMWNPYPAAWPIYLAAASSLVLPLAVLTLAIRGLARTTPAGIAPTGADDSGIRH
jgi:hypothetical protein